MNRFGNGERVVYVTEIGPSSLHGTILALSDDNGRPSAAVKWDDGDFDVQRIESLASVETIRVIVELDFEQARAYAKNYHPRGTEEWSDLTEVEDDFAVEVAKAVRALT